MKKALIVEDAIIVRKTLSSQLTKLGCIVDEANNRNEAIIKIMENQYDIIFLDNQMPDDKDKINIAGLLTAEFIRNKNSVIPIVSISSDVGELKMQYEALGVTKFIGKTIKVEDLKSILAEINFEEKSLEHMNHQEFDLKTDKVEERGARIGTLI